jgi:transcriptional regulator with XRE-family HTH domain
MAPPRSDSIDAIGERLRLIRIAYGYAQGRDREMSQVEFAALAGISKQGWNNAETGDSRIGIDSAMAVTRRTGVPLDYIYFGNLAGLPHAIAVEIEKLLAARAAKKRA